MREGESKVRLDEILLREGLISEDQLNKALVSQKAEGGRLGSQLLRHGYLDEPALVKALAKHFKREGVILTGLQVPPVVLKLIPARVAKARRVLPFYYDPEKNVLKIACEDPTDNDLINELNFVVRNKSVQLFVAAELPLKTAIAHFYEGRTVSQQEELLEDAADDAADTDTEQTLSGQTSSEPFAEHGTSVLLVNDDRQSGRLIREILEKDGYEVLAAESADDAIGMVGDKHIGTVLIKDTVTGDYLDLIDRVRKVSPKTTVRYFQSASALMLNEDAVATEGDLLINNLDLFTSLLSSKHGFPVNHAGRAC